MNTTVNRSKNQKGQQDLEPNHTHFLLLDDGTYYKYESGDYRTRFVLEASRYKNKGDIFIYFSIFNYLYYFFL